MAGLNQYYTGNWTGDPQNIEKNRITKPLAGILGNGLQLGLQSLEPPFLPLARSAENWVWRRFPEPRSNRPQERFSSFCGGIP